MRKPLTSAIFGAFCSTKRIVVEKCFVSTSRSQAIIRELDGPAMCSLWPGKRRVERISARSRFCTAEVRLLGLSALPLSPKLRPMLMATESGGCIPVGQSKIDFLDFRQHNPNTCIHLSPLGAVTGYISCRRRGCGICASDVAGIEGEIDHTRCLLQRPPEAREPQ